MQARLIVEFLIENQEKAKQAPEAHPKTFKVHSQMLN